MVGIQDFKNPKYNLSFSVADAELFAQTLREHSAPLFEHTDVKLLTSPADTTCEGVTRALKETLADVGVNDVFVFYAASHGVIDDDGAYYLITSNVDSAEALKEQALARPTSRCCSPTSRRRRSSWSWAPATVSRWAMPWPRLCARAA